MTAKAAGICFRSDSGKVLLLQRGLGGDHAGEWAFPGGHIEAGESAADAARRELAEECGYAYSGTLGIGAASDSFITHTALIDDEFAPSLNHEHTGAGWFEPGELPIPMHPNAAAFIASESFRRIGMNELDIARAIVAGELNSPQHYMNMDLWKIRITGTGVAYRSGLKEIVFRDPALFCTDDFVQRCNGLPVILEHPETRILNAKEYKEGNVGTVFLPYIEANEVWAIAKIFDPNVSLMMPKLSTSPGVSFSGVDDNFSRDIDGGATILIEGSPSLVDHIAICGLGVWDKGGSPAGISSNNQELIMTEEEQKAADKAKTDAAEALEREKARADAAEEENGKLKARVDAAEKAQGELAARVDSLCAMMPEKPAERTDSATLAGLRAELDALRAANAPLSDADRNALADTQSRTDSVMRAFGQSAQPPIAGETPAAYQHSPEWKSVDLGAVNDSQILSAAEKQIHADARIAARNPVVIGRGVLRATKTHTDSGHTVTEFSGDISAFMNGFKSPAKKLLKINKQGEVH